MRKLVRVAKETGKLARPLNSSRIPSGGCNAQVRHRARNPRAGKLTPEQLTAISQTSCGVLRKLGTEIQWVHSYVAADKIYCIYIAPNEELVKEHARQGGFPANSISEISAPSTRYL